MNEELNISELCRFIKNTVGDAVGKAAQSSEIREIKETVKSVAREVADEINTQVKSTGESVRKNIPPRVYKTPDPPVYQKVERVEPPRAPEVSGPPMWKGSTRALRIKGSVLSFFGVTGVTVGLAMLAVTGIVAANLVLDMTVALAMGLFSLIPFGIVIAFFFMAKRGISLHGIAARYKQYLATVGNDRFCPVKLLADSVGKKVRFVRKDLKRMIKAGMFPEGQLDKNGDTLILDVDTYHQYMMAQQRMEQHKKEAEPEPDKQAEDKPKSELELAIADGRDYIRRMRLANDLIDGEEMSRKIDRIEQVGLRIFELVEQHPEKLPDIRRFMNYYLPITIKLLEGYCKFDHQPVQGENIANAKKEIEETLDTITTAFENLLDSLFQREAMDLSSDISALEAMLAQEGLMGSDFKTDK